MNLGQNKEWVKKKGKLRDGFATFTRREKYWRNAPYEWVHLMVEYMYFYGCGGLSSSSETEALEKEK